MVLLLENQAVSISFVLDSGAAEVAIPADVFMTLMRSIPLDKPILLAMAWSGFMATRPCDARRCWRGSAAPRQARPACQAHASTSAGRSASPDVAGCLS